MIWKYTDPSRTVAISDDGCRSCLVTALPEGTEILPPDGPSPAERKAALESAVQAMLDGEAQAMGYDNLASCISYADEPAVAKYQAEGRKLRARRSVVWARCYEIMVEVQTGKRTEPTHTELLALLPAPKVTA